MNWKELMHFDPVTIIVLVVGLIAGWVTIRDTVKLQGDWIKKHDDECESQRKANTKTFVELQKISERLLVLTESHGERIQRIEQQLDAKL